MQEWASLQFFVSLSSLSMAGEAASERRWHIHIPNNSSSSSLVDGGGSSRSSNPISVIAPAFKCHPDREEFHLPRHK